MNFSIPHTYPSPVGGDNVPTMCLSAEKSIVNTQNNFFFFLFRRCKNLATQVFPYHLTTLGLKYVL